MAKLAFITYQAATERKQSQQGHNHYIKRVFITLDKRPSDEWLKRLKGTKSEIKWKQ